MAPADQCAAGAIPERIGKVVATTGGGAGNSAHISRSDRHLGRTGGTDVRGDASLCALRVLDKIAGVDGYQAAAEVGIAEGARQCQDATVLQLARTHKLHGCRQAGEHIDCAGVVAHRAIQQLQIGTVRPRRVQMHAAIGIAGFSIPAGYHDSAVGQYGCVEVEALAV